LIHSPIATRVQVIAEALTWLGTPYLKGAMVKSAGCDCGTFLFSVWRACGLITEEILEELGLPMDWFCNTREEKYIRAVQRHAAKIVEAISYPSLQAEPGNIVLSRHEPDGRLYNHGGIVIRWPRIVHSVYPRVEECDASTHWMWGNRQVCVFDPWRKP
jgi:cell wall-associated NlpC family hydrolase